MPDGPLRVHRHDAHLAAQRVHAHSISERTTLAMTAPVLVFAAILLAASLLRLPQP